MAAPAAKELENEQVEREPKVLSVTATLVTVALPVLMTVNR